MASSAVVAVKQATVAELRELPNLDGVAVDYAWTGEDAQSRERIFFGKASFPQTPGPMRTGRVHRDESGQVDIIVRVTLIGGTAEEADTRALEIGTEVEECVADHRNLGNTPDDGIFVTATTLRGGSLAGGYTDNGAVSELTYTLQWDARLT